MATVSHNARYQPEPIAIVGSSCRFAGGVTTPAKLWDLLLNPVHLSRPPPAERFNIDAFYHPDAEYHGTTDNPKAYWLDQDHRAFDASFFQITPKEAAAIDPQHRVTLEVVYESLESAGYSLQRYAGRNVAVYAGVMNADYDTLSQRDDLYASQYYATGNARSMAASRISYFFNFVGPSMTIDTACSSSLIALHQAVLSLRAGQCEMACVTGVNMMLAPEQFVVESNLHMLSPTGHCRMWDNQADGYARGEGAAAILIKTLSRALADGDHIQAVVRESGTNSDGRTKGITMPSPEAQTRLIRETYARAGLDPTVSSDRCQYFEAHGTGTKAGDSREAAAIRDAFFGRNSGSTSADGQGPALPQAKLGPGVRASASKGEDDQELLGDTIAPNQHQLEQTASSTKDQIAGRDGRLLVGSIKTVIGHTEGAAGLAGIFKVILGMQFGLVPPNLHFETLSEDVAPFYDRLRIPVRPEPWPETAPGQPRRASVNSFGFGGANAHAIIESYLPSFHDEIAKGICPELIFPKQLTSREGEPEIQLPLLLSATSEKSLVALITSYRDHVDSNPQLNIQQLAWQTFARRTALPFRTTISPASRADLVEQLDTFIAKAISNAIGHRAQQTSSAPRILGIFTGQGAQWLTMSKQLLLTSKSYRQTISELDRVLQHCASPPLWSLEGQIMADSTGSRIQEAAVAQPLCTALQIALVDLLRSIGIQFTCVVGHSSGEIAAAYAADRLTAKDAILIAYYRGLYAHLAKGKDGKKGGMLAVGLSKQDAAKLCTSEQYRGRVAIAASNSPKSITLSGDEDAIDEVEKQLSQNGIFARRLQVDTAYHSPHMAAPAKMYASSLDRSNVSSLEAGQGSPIWISSVYGGGEPSDEELRGAYWRDNMVQPVLFQEAVQRAVQECGPFDCAIEIGPHPALKGPVSETVEAMANAEIPYSSPLSRGKDDRQALSEFLGFLWTRNGPEHLDMAAYIRQSSQPHLLNKDPVQAVSMPTYPWDHSQTYWRESRISKQYHHRRHPPHELLGARTRDDNDDELRWRNILKTNEVPWLQGHVFQGQMLLPASAYLIMALDATKVVLDGRPASLVELEELHFLAGIVVEPDTDGVEVLCSLKVITEYNEQPSQTSGTVEAAFTVCSGPPDGSLPMKKNFTCGVRVVLDKPNADFLPHQQSNQAETLPTNVERFYEMMAQTSLTYSGPFKAIETLHRRYNFATATLKRFHADDSTTLSISPATLDCALQATFATYSSPGDKALWTTFLPKKMARVRFNMALCDVKSERAEAAQDVLTVESHLTNETLVSRDVSAKFTGDVCVFDAEGRMEIQVEDLTVSSFAAMRREDDHELLMRSAWEVDCEDEIVQPQDAGAEDKGIGVKLALRESCERVASFYLRHSQSDPSEQRHSHLPNKALSNAWPQETTETLGTFINTSPYQKVLSLVQTLGNDVASILPGILPDIIEEAHQLHKFHVHIERVSRLYIAIRGCGCSTSPIRKLGCSGTSWLGLDRHSLSWSRRRMPAWKL
jgi:acyl transferase domain-containing protein